MRAIVIILRNLHLGYIGCYGNEWVQTPTLDRLAVEGSVFDQHFAVRPDDESSRQTGKYSFPPVPPEKLAPITNSDPVLEELSRRGIETKRLVDPSVEELSPIDSSLIQIDFTDLVQNWAVAEPKAEDDAPADEETEMEEIDPEDGRFLQIQEKYAAAVEEADRRLGELLEELDRSALGKDMLLIVTSDRGTHLHRADHLLHEEVVHVPLIVRMPDGQGAGRRCSALTQSVDLLPTLFDFFGIDGQGSQGRSLLPLIRGDRPAWRTYGCAGLATADRVEWMIRTSEWCFVLPVWTKSSESLAGRLFVKPDDRWEVNDVGQHQPELCERLERTLRGFVEASRKEGAFEAPPLELFETEESNR